MPREDEAPSHLVGRSLEGSLALLVSSLELLDCEEGESLADEQDSVAFAVGSSPVSRITLPQLSHL